MIGSAARPRMQPLESRHVGGLQLLLQSRFNRERLASHLAANPGLSWRVEQTGQYVVAGYWRRRPEIASVVELAPGPHRQQLIQQVLESADRIGCELVLAESYVPRRDLTLWRELGFEAVDQIVEYRWTSGRVEDEPRLNPRQYDPDDLASLLALDRRSFPWLWWNSSAEQVHYAEASETEIWVVDHPDEPHQLGAYVGITFRGTLGHLDRLAVDSELRRRGLGSALVQHSLRRFVTRGTRQVTLTTQFDNARAQPLYARFGFHPTRNVLTIYGRWLGRQRDRTP